MMKFVFVMCVAVALMHETQAFKVVSIYKGTSFSAPTSAPAAPAFDTSALVQGVQSAISSKLQQAQTLVNSLIQQKAAFNQIALNSLQSSVASSPAFVIRKQIYVGAPPKPAVATESTTSADADATTTSD